MAWLKLHHGCIGLFLILWCILTYHGIAVIGKFNLTVWLTGLILGIILFIHDLWCHLKPKAKR